MPRLSDDQLAARSLSIGASEVAMVLGLSRFGGSHELMARKRSGTDTMSDSWAATVGSVLEPAVAELVAVRTGIKLRAYRRTLRHPRFPAVPLTATPDYGTAGEGYEIKVSSAFDEWGDDGDPLGAPVGYRVQAQAQMAVVRAWRRVTICALLGGRDLRLYPQDRNPDQIMAIEDACADWWQRYMVDGEELPPDGSDAAMDTIRARFPRETEEERVATAEESMVADELASITDRIKAMETRSALLRQQLANGMGTAAVLVGPGWKATFRTEAGRVGWKAVAEAAAASAELIEANRAPGERVFRFTPARKKKEAAA